MEWQPGFCEHCDRYVTDDYWHDPDCPALSTEAPSKESEGKGGGIPDQPVCAPAFGAATAKPCKSEGGS